MFLDGDFVICVNNLTYVFKGLSVLVSVYLNLDTIRFCDF